MKLAKITTPQNPKIMNFNLQKKSFPPGGLSYLTGLVGTRSCTRTNMYCGFLSSTTCKRKMLQKMEGLLIMSHVRGGGGGTCNILCFQCEDFSEVCLVSKVYTNITNYWVCNDFLCHMALLGVRGLLNSMHVHIFTQIVVSFHSHWSLF